MKKQKIEFQLPCERDHPIPEPDPNLTEEEKKQIVAEADARLKELARNRKKYALSREEIIKLEILESQ